MRRSAGVDENENARDRADDDGREPHADECARQSVMTRYAILRYNLFKEKYEVHGQSNL